MSACLFVASGLDFDVDKCLAKTPFKAQSVFRNSAIPAKDNPDLQPRPDSGFLVLVAEDSEAILFPVLQSALNFLMEHEKEILNLRGLGVDNMFFDFGVENQGELQPTHYLPPELVAALARLGMGVAFSFLRAPQE